MGWLYPMASQTALDFFVWQVNQALLIRYLLVIAKLRHQTMNRYLSVPMVFN